MPSTSEPAVVLMCWLETLTCNRLSVLAEQEAPVFHLYTSMELLARERRDEALTAARTEQLLRSTGPRPSSAWAQFNHYHYWPEPDEYAQTEATLRSERIERSLRRRPGLLQRLVTVVSQFFDRPAEA